MINATQMGIHDDRELLVELHLFLEQRPKISVLFVVNKVDALDTERESLEKLMMEIRGYLGNCGFASPNILPLSALSAYLFTKVLNGEVLSRKQRRDFQAAFDLYQPNQMSLVSYTMTDDYPKQYEYVQIDDGEYRVSDIIGAHTNTGIPYLEQYIQQEQIRSAAKQQLRINVNKNKEGKK
jgi:translation elongation factor EF-1alpha